MASKGIVLSWFGMALIFAGVGAIVFTLDAGGPGSPSAADDDLAAVVRLGSGE